MVMMYLQLLLQPQKKKILHIPSILLCKLKPFDVTEHKKLLNVQRGGYGSAVNCKQCMHQLYGTSKALNENGKTNEKS